MSRTASQTGRDWFEHFLRLSLSAELCWCYGMFVTHSGGAGQFSEGGEAVRQGAGIHLFDQETKFNCDILQVSSSFTKAVWEGGELRSVQTHPCPWCSQRHEGTCLAAPRGVQAGWEAPGPRAGLCWPLWNLRDKRPYVLLGLTGRSASR